MRKYLLLAVVAMLLGCGDRMPESKAAKDAGKAPKQTLDKAAAGAADAMSEAAERAKDGGGQKQ